MKNDKQRPENICPKCKGVGMGGVTGIDNLEYDICYRCGYSSLPKSQLKHLDQSPLSNETKVVESVTIKTTEEFIKTIYVNAANFNHIASTEKINGSLYTEIKRVMEAYASQFKNTDAVRVITDRIEKLENNLAFRTHGWLGNKLKYQLQEAKDILKLIQP